jgi:biopolymer transport protein ExbB
MRPRLASLAIIATAGTAALAAAQSPGATQTSLLKIFYEGLELPSYLIFAGSIVVLAIIVEHFINVRRAAVSPREQIQRARELIERRSFRECLDLVRKSRTYFAQVMTAALNRARHGFDSMHEAALEKSGELSGRLFRKAEYLNIIGNLGPLLGLLGTVWGMIKAFGSLGAGGGQASAGDLADGISTALVNTALGLALAILGIGFYGLCRNRIDALAAAATIDALDLLEYFRPSNLGRGGESRSASAAPAAATEPG